MLAPKCAAPGEWHPFEIGTLIRQWYDETTNLVDGDWFTADLAPSKTLAVVAPGAVESSYRGRRTVLITGGGYNRTQALTSTEPCEVWTACKCIGTGVIFSGRTAQSTVLRRSNGTTGLYVYNSAGGEVAITVASGKSLTNRWAVLRARFNGATSEVWEDGVLCGTANLAGLLDPSGLTVGAHTDGWGVADCEYGEVLVTELLTATTAYRLAAYLMRKWV